MIILGLTGTTGAGKGEVGRVFSSLGAVVADTDAIYHDLLKGNENLRQALISEFGDVTDEQGFIDRRKLASLVFSNKAYLDRLNEISHKFVLAEVSAFFSRAEKNGAKVGVIDAPLLFESGANESCSAVVGVIAPAHVRLERIMKRDGLTKEAALERISSQHEDEWFSDHCDIVIVNDGPKDNLRLAAQKAYEKLVEKMGGN